MKIFKWEGRGHYLDATIIVVADCLKSAKEMIEKELIDNGLTKSWEETQEVSVFETDNLEIIHSNNGDY